MGEKRGLRGLQAWCRIVTEGHKNVHVCDMSTSWRNGLAFCALIHHFRPDLIDFDTLSQDDIMYNNRLAFTVAEQHLGIPALLDPEDMLKYEEPDKLSIATYVSQFYQYFVGRGRADEKVRTPVKRSFVDRTFTPTALPAKVPLKGFKRDEKCFKCRNRVFILERLMVDGKLYHRMCFQCCRCHTVLRPGAYAKGDDEGLYECVVCPVDEKKPKSAFDTSEAEVKIINGDAQLEDKDDNLMVKKEPPTVDFNLNGNNAVKEAQKIFLERELSNSENTDLGLNNQTISENEGTKFDISKCKNEVDGGVTQIAETDVSILNLDSGGQGSDSVHTSLDVADEKDQTKHSFSYKPNQAEELSAQDDTVEKLLSSEVLQIASSAGNSPIIAKESLEDTQEKQPTPPLRSKRKHLGVLVDTSGNETLNVPSRNFGSLNFRRVHSSIELSSEKEGSSTVQLPTITSPSYNLPVISPVSSFPGKVKIPSVFQRTSLPPTTLSFASSVSPLSQSSLLQSRYSLYSRSLSNKSLVSESLLQDGNLSPTQRQSSLDKEVAKSTHMLDKEVTLESENTSSQFTLRRHSDGNNSLLETVNCQDVFQKETNNDLSDSTDSNLPLKEPAGALPIPKADTSDGHVLDKEKPKEPAATESLKKPVVMVEVICKVIKPLDVQVSYPGELNPFGEDEEVETYPDELNPFGDSDEERTEEHQKTEPRRSITDSSSLHLSSHGSDYDDSLNPFCDSEDDFSVETSSLVMQRMPGKAQISKKKRAPLPPSSVLLSSKPSSPSVSPASSVKPSPRMQKRLAPKPPSPDNKGKTSDQDKATKNETNLCIVKGSDALSDKEARDTNTFGYWKRKKRPAPSVPVPRRQIRRIPLNEIQEELEEIWEKQSELENQGRQLEMTIRDQPDSGGGDSKEDEDEDLIVKLFELVNQKNDLFRRQAELMYIKRSQNLEEEQAELEYQIRCLMSKPERLRSEADGEREEELLLRLVEVVEHRNEIVESMDMDRQRVQDEDLSIKEQFSRQSSSSDLPKDAAMENSTEEKAKKKKSKFKDKFKKDSGKKATSEEGKSRKKDKRS